jgi:heme exporter protein B
MFADATAVMVKDLRVEMRSKVALWQVTPFALTMLLLFAFALDPDRGILQRASGGLFWIAVLFSTILLVQRSFAIERSDGNSDGLRMLAIEPASIYLGKAAALFVQLILLETALFASAFVLYDIALVSLGQMLVVGLLTAAGLVASATLYGAVASSGPGNSGNTLLPLLFLPAVAPVLIAATRASEIAMDLGSGPIAPWLGLSALFAILYLGVGVLLFESALEDA